MDQQSNTLGANYHITQSKIALGSGGFFGKGFLEGTQSHLNFIPELETDFIFFIFYCNLLDNKNKFRIKKLFFKNFWR